MSVSASTANPADRHEANDTEFIAGKVNLSKFCINGSDKAGVAFHDGHRVRTSRPHGKTMMRPIFTLPEPGEGKPEAIRVDVRRVAFPLRPGAHGY